MKDNQRLSPGRELDALIAEKVMGLKPKFQVPQLYLNQLYLTQFDTLEQVEQFRITPGFAEQIEPKRYSTDISAAWEVVQKLGNAEIRTYFISEPKFVEVGIYNKSEKEWHYELGETAPHAICLAALKAVGALD
jgi:hypothetical protein